MKVTVAGAGYVGLSNAVLLARENEVTIVDINQARVDLVMAGRSPIKDEDIEAAFREGGLFFLLEGLLELGAIEAMVESVRFH